MSKQTFKIGDEVFHSAYGWGMVTSITNEDCPVEVDFYNFGCEWFTEEGRTLPGFPLVLSFTEYSYEGFSLEKPEKMPTIGQIVWVRNDKDDRYDIYHFIHYIKNAKYPYIVSSDNDEENIVSFKFLTTYNPYANDSEAKSNRSN